MTEFATVNGLTLNYTVEGDQSGLPLVFINSLGTDLRIWDGVAPHFLDRCRLIRYDKRGHGLSECPPAPYSIRDHSTDLLGLMDHLDIQQAVLVGISVGGMIALDFAAAWPSRVQKLVLCDTAAVIGTAELWNDRIGALREHGMVYLAGIMPVRWFTKTYSENSPTYQNGYINMLIRTPLEGYIGTCEAIRDADLTGAARTIQVPALALCGEEDKSTPPELVRSLLDLLPHVSYEEIPDSAHLPCIEQPDKMAALIDDFLWS